jgi:glutathione reductase (NADPH)
LATIDKAIGYSSLENFDYDLFILGAGSGGVRASRVAANLGARVAIAEERYFGGTCVNAGCVPKKLLSYAAHYRDDFDDSVGFGWSSSAATFDWNRLIENKDKEINRLNGIYKSILNDNDVTIYEARATIAGPNQVLVEGKMVSARYILIAVGGWPWIPQFEGSEAAISSNEVFHLESLPESITILGGGYIAVEFASIFAWLGCDTTLIYRGDKLLRGFDDDVRTFLTTEIGRHCKLILEDDVGKITQYDNKLKISLKSGAEIISEVCMAATGRRPNTDKLGLEAANIDTDKNGAICVDDQFQTSQPGIFAIGDVIDRIQLTPVALAEGELVARTLFPDPAAGFPVKMEYLNIPTAVFCHPNVGTVGLTEQQARARKLDIEVFVAKVRQLKHTLSGRDEMSLIKLIVNKADDRVIGLHIVAPDAGELTQGFAVAMNCGATKADFDRTLGIHPTLAEELVTMRHKRKDHTPQS